MFEDELKEKVQDFRRQGIPAYVKRDGRLPIVDRMVTTVIGARRAGKSFRVVQAADEMVKAGAIPSIRHVCHLDFDNPVLSRMTAPALGTIQHTLLSLSPEIDLHTPVLFVFDELHRIAGWEEYVIDLSRNPAWKVIVTGSSSRLLRIDVAAALRGKAVSSEIYPLSFPEFLRFNGFHLAPESTKGKAELRRMFGRYLRQGGFPAVATADEFTADAVLREYFGVMILRDIIQRYNVSKPAQCVYLLEYLLSNIGKPFTLQSAYAALTQAGFTTSRDSVREYVSAAADAWLVFTVPLYSQSTKEQDRNYKKLYAIDWALAHRNSPVWDGGSSRALENAVFMHLRRSRRRVNYYLTRGKRQEVDFITTDNSGKPHEAIQVCLDPSSPDTLKRELEPLVATARYFGIKTCRILTLSAEGVHKAQGVKVMVAPAWKWMTQE